MLKGAQKRMIVIRTRDSRLFEEAYFVMRRDLPDSATHGADMLEEANRIIQHSLDASARVSDKPLHSVKHRLRWLWPALFAVMGFLSGGFLCGALVFLCL